jgi:hypothetical protein
VYENDVFWFDVAMEYFVFVHELHCVEEVADDEGGGLL